MYDVFRNIYCEFNLTSGHCYYTETAMYGEYGDPARCADCIETGVPYWNKRIYNNSLVTCCCRRGDIACPDDL